MDHDVMEQKEQQKERGKGEHTNSKVEGQNRGRLGQIRDVEKNEG